MNRQIDILANLAVAELNQAIIEQFSTFMDWHAGELEAENDEQLNEQMAELHQAIKRRLVESLLIDLYKG